jgi:hypothetical protein
MPPSQKILTQNKCLQIKLTIDSISYLEYLYYSSIRNKVVRDSASRTVWKYLVFKLIIQGNNLNK